MIEAKVSPDRTTALLWCVLCALLLWSISPILDPVNVEGFSAAIVGLGERLFQGDLQRFDQLHPFNVEFFALSKFGAVLNVAVLTRWFGLDGVTAIKIVIWASEIVLLAATAVLVRRWSGASRLTAAAAILLVPGLLENSFFINDNVPAAALAALALLCWSRTPTAAKALLGGALLGFAALTRSDTILLAVAAPLIFFEQTKDARRCLGLLAAAAIGGALVWCGGLALFGASVLDVLRVGRHAVALWARPQNFQYQEVLIFIGVPGLLLAMTGVIEALTQKLFVRLAFLMAPVLAVAIVIGSSLWQSRQLLTLAPFFATLVAFGLDRIVGRSARQNETVLRACVIALVAVAWLWPQKAALDEGPRALFGRLYSPWQWSDWQKRARADVAVIDRLIAGAPGQTRALVTDDWSIDRYVNQQATAAGFTLASPQQTEAACRTIAEIFSRGDRRIAHIRIHQPFLPETRLLDRARFDSLALPCLDALAPSQTVWLRSGMPSPQDAPASDKVTSSILSRVEAFLRADSPPLIATPLDQAGLQRLKARYAEEEAEEKPKFAEARRGARSVEAAMAATRQIIPFPRPK
ncbi:hypothetical protein CCR94_22855 [Rhodoblastus sphagnicola]|uniref:Glycosyltransferase RgtA/B/C/D-like domain-containing protein n=1 Tax=Rhodoblastus sphagnicola TaxID=333368 RepID=A0A2S6MVS0_9HYPH|nr:hypothetical protein [Rhodoblastus sphagnicola]MBB4198309.1 uncharacterized membrane protein YhaH (DUF805 family) [Rhodoblastus sphagnicola]PPQ26463.1 hypothetical protein CCR94_22855 [Rhodoblastus sphagnicola]